MSSSNSIHASSPYQSRNGSTTTLQTLNNADPTPTRAGRLAVLARLRIPTASPRRKKNNTTPMDSSRPVSVYSNATTCDQLPTPGSDLTLAPSFTGSEKLEVDGHKSLARSLMHRSSRMFLRKKSSKASLASTFILDDDELRRGSVESTRRPGSKHSRAHSRPRHEADAAQNKPQISQPFNFQHLAHTAPVEAISALRQISPSALETEFSAMQANQSPTRELKHLDLDSLKPATADGVNKSPSKERPQLRSAKSNDSFKRQSKSFSQPFFQGPTPPPRRSSRKRPAYLANVVVPPRPALKESPTIPEFMVSPPNRPRTAPSPKSPLRIATSAASTPLGMTGIAQAVTTPDDTACVLGPDLSLLEDVLEDVPEEDDYLAAKTAKSATSKPQSPIYRSKSCRSPSENLHKSGSSHNVASVEFPSKLPQRVPDKIQPPQNWDDDIDYCYHHALNQPLSPYLESPVPDANEMLFMREHRRQGSRSSKGSIDGSTGIPKPTHLRRPSGSGQLQNKQARPPSMLNAPVDSAGNVMFTLSPSMIVPQEYTTEEPTTYEIRHSRQASTKSSGSSQMQLFTPSISDLSRAYSSPRSSFTFSNSSKRNSCMAGGSSTSLSALSTPDVDCNTVCQQNRKSIGAHNAPVATTIPQSPRKSDADEAPPTPTQELVQQMGTKNAKTEEAASGEVSSDEVKEAVDVVSNMPQQPLRARAKSESASRAAAQGGAAAKTASHNRSVSSAATATAMPKKATYSLFPPLDRIGAASTTRA